MKDYKTVVSGELEWMAEDFEINGNVYFNWAEAVANCPEGWRIPTVDEWETAHLKMMNLNGNGCKYKNKDVADHVGRSYYWSSSSYITNDGGTDERLGVGIYVKGWRGINEHFFFKTSYYPVRYVRDHEKVTYVVYDQYNKVAYVGADVNTAKEKTSKLGEKCTAVEVWVNGMRKRSVSGAVDKMYLFNSLS